MVPTDFVRGTREIPVAGREVEEEKEAKQQRDGQQPRLHIPCPRLDRVVTEWNTGARDELIMDP